MPSGCPCFPRMGAEVFSCLGLTVTNGKARPPSIGDQALLSVNGVVCRRSTPFDHACASIARWSRRAPRPRPLPSGPMAISFRRPWTWPNPPSAALKRQIVLSLATTQTFPRGSAAICFPSPLTLNRKPVLSTSREPGFPFTHHLTPHTTTTRSIFYLKSSMPHIMAAS